MTTQDPAPGRTIAAARAALVAAERGTQPPPGLGPRAALPDLALLPGAGPEAGLALARGRMHEICGPSRRIAALWAGRSAAAVADAGGAADTAGAAPDTIVWIRPRWRPEALYPPGIAPILDPARLLIVTPDRAPDLLWAAEEVLRAGVAALMVADLPDPPGLTAVRRLHLAAETGAAEGRCPTTGLLLLPGDGGAPGVESRWSLHPVAGGPRPGDPPGTPRAHWRLARLRARRAPPGAWPVTARNDAVPRLDTDVPGPG